MNMGIKLNECQDTKLQSRCRHKQLILKCIAHVCCVADVKKESVVGM